MTEHGPFETERDALATEAAAFIRAAFDDHPGYGASVPECLQVLTDACAAAGISLGKHDLSVLTGIAWRETADAVVIAGLIRRAWDAGSPLASCRHCGIDIDPCQHPRGFSPGCEGWRHDEHEDFRVGGHYCRGRTIKTSAQPKEVPNAG